MESLLSEIATAARQIDVGVLPLAATAIALLAVLSGLAARVVHFVEDFQLAAAGQAQETPDRGDQ